MLKATLRAHRAPFTIIISIHAFHAVRCQQRSRGDGMSARAIWHFIGDCRWQTKARVPHRLTLAAGPIAQRHIVFHCVPQQAFVVWPPHTFACRDSPFFFFSCSNPFRAGDFRLLCPCATVQRRLIVVYKCVVCSPMVMHGADTFASSHTAHKPHSLAGRSFICVAEFESTCLPTIINTRRTMEGTRFVCTVSHLILIIMEYSMRIADNRRNRRKNDHLFLKWAVSRQYLVCPQQTPIDDDNDNCP